VSQLLTQSPFVVAHDHDYPFGKRRCIVSAGTTIEIADVSRFISQESRVEVAEPVDFQRPQTPRQQRRGAGSYRQHLTSCSSKLRYKNSGDRLHRRGDPSAPH
jgi:hypothetical protein